MTNQKRKTNLPFAPTLRFSPTAWAKLVYLRDRGETEVGGFGVTAEDDPFVIEEFHLVQQTCSPVSVCFDDAAVADYFDRHVDRALKPSRFARIWLHTHPGDSATPSWVDEETFHRVFGSTDWAVMFIVARGGQTYARLRFNAGPGASLVVPVAIDYSRPFAASDCAAWDLEYGACLRQAPALPLVTTGHLFPDSIGDGKPQGPEPWPDLWDDWMPGQYYDLYDEGGVR